MHIKKNDQVIVIAGRDKGKKGKVLRVIPVTGRALVEGINFVKKHARKTKQDQQGGIIQMELPINSSNLSISCPKCNRPARTRVKDLADGTKMRSCVRCGEAI
ncbi:MAG: 50S ribosomal protein L24 [Candidatus Omnitrophica bacterium CG12_big_fil_rev_8_21_14_0_65_43_15]|uniref:Large ribosomal subunit protein uL24 n=1 Tax=Candidatus Taenaricola geysiri TaxID=1974752 RepID=A0A2J0LPP8_9BACT|nr:MAG: 50S ribosomal protein L24 [Candidatus Omnitrophica bacterium CG1_02_43_210]PIR66046.1 MAG: 50S ribosomal protein L24 [Candidatus Omnitrophica bacterium CG10_big_fil_rev_8_21_14_0_10_43_8]PIV12123.1 MAG: 50S ribosomal protein L24 [Candidatus Omnitrophica bacterium CG03_land_8_20_14_0_80_43_22]PIW66746.1 MAG: 50S ribosomal protein L24 [Candidatus Omnitrophica bacterium CG12_big_fil_rev_8_21_14_0_65_43_15]PIW79773.1 MAG: 50S ribosomal protein L24 [Candidatus Omnitrophica bacterium CG_4_8_1